MKRNRFPMIDVLESRTLLSGSLSVAAAPPTSSSTATASATAVKTVAGPTLNLTAGVPFQGTVGFYATPVLDPPDGYSATINWGDGTTATKATLAYGTSGKAFGEIISGEHVYAKPGNYVVTTTFIVGPISPMFKLPTTVLEKLVDKTVVAPFPSNTSGGVTIDETINKSFTADLGTFTFIAPATNLSATISWGDGTTSKATITSTGVIGLDVIKFKITGTHTYTLAGKFPVHIVVTRPSQTVNGAIIATIESTAIVAPVKATASQVL